MRAYPLRPSRLKTLIINMCSSCKCIPSFIPQISSTTLDVQLLIKGISNHLKMKMKLSGKNLPRVTQWTFCLFLLLFFWYHQSFLFLLFLVVIDLKCSYKHSYNNSQNWLFCFGGTVKFYQRHSISFAEIKNLKIIVFSCIFTYEPSMIQRIVRNSWSQNDPGSTVWVTKQNTLMSKGNEVCSREMTEGRW